MAHNLNDGYSVCDQRCHQWFVSVTVLPISGISGLIALYSGPLIVSTFGWSAYDSLLWQMPLGGVCFFGILIVGYVSLKVRNMRLIMLATCCVPVVVGSVMIWKSTWYRRAATPIAGYTILGFFAPVTSLVVSLGMVNVVSPTQVRAFTMRCSPLPRLELRRRALPRQLPLFSTASAISLGHSSSSRRLCRDTILGFGRLL